LFLSKSKTNAISVIDDVQDDIMPCLTLMGLSHMNFKVMKRQTGLSKVDIRVIAGALVKSDDVKTEKNKQGQLLGAKGQATRLQLLDATFKLLHELPFNEVVVSAITSLAATSTATFYRYFSDLDEAFLELSILAGKDMAALDRLLHELWPENEIEDFARRFVAAHVNLVRLHRPVIHVRNFSADRGDEAFDKVRISSARSIIVGLGRQIHRTFSDARNDVVESAECKAAVLFTGMERLAIQLTAPRSADPREVEIIIAAQADILTDVIRAAMQKI
jgi:AcrR family transcriptional regulator